MCIILSFLRPPTWSPSCYLFFLQRLNNLLDTHLQVFDVVPLRLQQFLDDLWPLLQHPQLRILVARASSGDRVRLWSGVQGFGLRWQKRHLWKDQRRGIELNWNSVLRLLKWELSFSPKLTDLSCLVIWQIQLQNQFIYYHIICTKLAKTQICWRGKKKIRGVSIHL